MKDVGGDVRFAAEVVAVFGSGSDVTICVRDVVGVEVANSLFRVQRTGATWELASLIRGVRRECPSGARELRLVLREGQSGLRAGDRVMQTPAEALTPVWRPPGSGELPPELSEIPLGLGCSARVLDAAEQRLEGYISRWGEDDRRVGLLAIRLAERALNARSPRVAAGAAARAVTIFERAQCEEQLSEARFAHGAASVRLGNTSRGLSEMLAALRLREGIGSRRFFAPGVFTTLAEAHETQGELSASKLYLEKALAQLAEVERLPTRSGEPPARDYARAKFALARVLQGLGEGGPEASAFAREAHRIYAEESPPIWGSRAAVVEAWLRANAR